MLMGGRQHRPCWAESGSMLSSSLASDLHHLPPIKSLAFRHLGKSAGQTTEPRYRGLKISSVKLDYPVRSSLPSSKISKRIWKSATPLLYLWAMTISSSLLSETLAITLKLYDKIKRNQRSPLTELMVYMILDQGQEKQFWIAGGIGITPFISYIRENPNRIVQSAAVLTLELCCLTCSKTCSRTAVWPSNLVDSKVSAI